MSAAPNRLFNWITDGQDIVVTEQLAIAVYTNGRGDVVVRQGGGYPDEDPFIVIKPIHAQALADAILRAAGIIDEPTGAPQAKTPAERARAYRERHRDGRVTASVTPRDANPQLLLTG